MTNLEPPRAKAVSTSGLLRVGMENENVMNMPTRMEREGNQSMASLKPRHNFHYSGKVPKASMERLRELAQCNSTREIIMGHRDSNRPRNL